MPRRPLPAFYEISEEEAIGKLARSNAKEDDARLIAAHAQTMPPATPKAEITVAQALACALQLQQLGELDSAETLYAQILQTLPEQPDALHFLGVLQGQRGHTAEAIRLIRKACELIPNHPDCHIDLGNLLAESGLLPEAASAYRRALALAPQSAELYNNLGVVFKLLGRWDEAETCYLEAIELAPSATNAYNNLGLLCAARGQVKDAIRCYTRAIARVPESGDSRRLLGVAWYSLGQIDKAAEVFGQWLAVESDNPVARHLYAACSGQNIPTRATDDYVALTFDRFAANFDKQLQENLAYCAPERVAAALAHARPAGNLQILDAGCGTGLCGPLLRPLAGQLSGVDLSGGMLARAATRQCYDVLDQAELTAYIAARPAAFDAIISADTLVYFGALEAVCAAAHQALRPQGVFIFTLEQLPAGHARHDFALNPHGRYAHSQAHAHAALSAAGLSRIRIEATSLRNEGGKPVLGWLVSAQRETG